MDFAEATLSGCPQ